MKLHGEPFTDTDPTIGDTNSAINSLAFPVISVTEHFIVKIS